MEDLFNTQSEIQEELTDTQVAEVETEEIDDLPADDAVLPTEESSENEESVEDTEESSENEILSEEKPKKEDKLNPYEQIILAEMERRANEGDTKVADALQSKDKSIHACFEYVKAQAKKKAVAGCAMIEDTQVYAWAHHYYIEPKAVIEKELHPKPTKTNADTKGGKVIPLPIKGVEKPKKPSNPKNAGKNNPLLQKVAKSKKKTATTKTSDKVTTKKVNGKVFTITEFSLF